LGGTKCKPEVNTSKIPIQRLHGARPRARRYPASLRTYVCPGVRKMGRLPHVYRRRGGIRRSVLLPPAGNRYCYTTPAWTQDSRQASLMKSTHTRGLDPKSQRCLSPWRRPAQGTPEQPLFVVWCSAPLGHHLLPGCRPLRIVYDTQQCGVLRKAYVFSSAAMVVSYCYLACAASRFK